ncbi:MAG: hypothetical protein MI919_24260, partial [Holophagales bacterium]|nr:hypothetical protein [Holophagales bacterium]
ARQALHDDGEEIHLALWPTVKEIHQVASRHYAFEGRCFVVAAGSILSMADLPSGLRLADAALARAREGDGDALALCGGSAVIGPDGEYVQEPVFDREALLICDLDLEAIDRHAMTLDVSGHYSRPDLLQLRLERGAPRAVPLGTGSVRDGDSSGETASAGGDPRAAG